MRPDEFLRASRVLMVAGKGGVGKTAVSTALALLAVEVGLRPLLVSVERGGGHPALRDGGHLHVTPDDALTEYLADHGLGIVARRLASSGAVDVVATAAPGIRDLLVLGKIKQLERSGEHDLLVVDAPAAGHAVSFLTAAATLRDLVQSGPVRVQADDVLAMLGDPARCSLLLVAVPEETPVNEVVETAFLLEDRVGLKLGPVVVNGIVAGHPALAVAPTRAAGAVGRRVSPGDRARLADAAAATIREAARQAVQLERLGDGLPLPQLRLGRAPASRRGDGLAGFLAGELRAAIEAQP